MNILITGGTGFLGSHLARRLLIEGHNVLIAKRSASNLSRLELFIDEFKFFNIDLIPLEEIFKENHIEIIVHCATNYGRFEISPSNIIQTNLILPLDILNVIDKYPTVKAFINTDTLLDKRVNSYSISKKQFVEWFYLFKSKMVCCNVALEHFYGPFDDQSKFVSKVILDLLSNIEFINFTKGEQKRDFIFIDDVIEAFVKIIHFSVNTSNDFYRFEIGTGKNISIQDFVNLVKILSKNTTTQLNYGAIPYRENEVMESNVDISNLSYLGWQAKTSLIDGLSYTIAQEKQILKL